MSKFNLEAAKRGEAVQAITAISAWIDMGFIGIDSGGYVVVEDEDGCLYRYAHDSKNIRMKPKQREMWIFPYSSDGVIFTSTPCETRSEAEIVRLNFPRPAGEVQMILVEE